MPIVMKMENKYQEALDRLLNDDYDFSHDFYEDDKATAMERDINTLQELVDKATPKKPIISYPMGDCYYTCSCCGHLLIEKRIVISPSGKHLIKDLSYCEKCGGKVDWNDIDDR